MGKPRNVEDYRKLAAGRLPRMVFDYLDGAAESERGLRRNAAAFESICFAPRRLENVSKRDLSIELFGRQQQMPLVIAPTGLNGALWPDGDVVLARAAANAGIPFVLSTASNTTIEEVAARAGGDLWFQLYVVQRALARSLTERALVAGYKTLVLTVDVAVNGKRERDIRNGFAIPFRYSPRAMLDGVLHPTWLVRQSTHGLPTLANFGGAGSTDVNAQAALMNRQMDASFTWDDLKALRDLWPHTLLVKGVLSADEAERCVGLGVDAVVISNHGARQLEDVAAPISQLFEIAGRIHQPILVDSGFRRGADVVKALALGAKAVMLGRATLYGLAASGETGVTDVLRIIRQEIDTTLALIGCARAADLGWKSILGQTAHCSLSEAERKRSVAGLNRWHGRRCARYLSALPLSRCQCWQVVEHRQQTVGVRNSLETPSTIGDVTVGTSTTASICSRVRKPTILRSKRFFGTASACSIMRRWTTSRRAVNLRNERSAARQMLRAASCPGHTPGGPRCLR